MRGRTLALLVAGVLGCEELPPLPIGTCGNGILEGGEDCDRFPDAALGPSLRCGGTDGPSERACRYVCDDGGECPDGWACRPDRVCHHATGRFVEVPGPREPIEPAAVGDVDGDGVHDVVGASGGQLLVGFGDGAGGIDEHLLRRTLPLGSRPPAAGDLDGDRHLDAVVPAPVGLVVLRGQPDRVVEPVAYAPYSLPSTGVLDWVLPLHVHRIAPEAALLYVSAVSADEIGFSVIPTFGEVPGGESALAARPSALPARLPVADFDRDGDEEVVLAPYGDDVVHVATTSSFTGKVILEPSGAVVSLARHRIDHGALVADLDGDGALDLLVSVQADPDEVPSVRAMRILGDGAGHFGPAEVDPRFDAEWPLAAGDLDGDGAADYVDANGIWIAGADGALTLGVAPLLGERWDEAAILDLDGDERPDVVATVADEPVLVVVFAAGALLPTTSEIATAGPPSNLRVGHFDGVPPAGPSGQEGPDDLAFRIDDEIAILFGEFDDLPGPPIAVGHLPGMAHLEAGVLRDQRGHCDGATDLVATTVPRADGRFRIAAFAGAASRVLDAPLLLLGGLEPRRPWAVAVGRFRPPGPGASSSEIVAIAGPLDSPALWVVDDAFDPALDPSRITRHDATELGHFPVSCASWATGDVDGDGADELVGVGPMPGCGTGEEAALVRIEATPDGSFAAGAPEDLGGFARRALVLADVDGDREADAIVAIVMPDATDATDEGVRVHWSADPGAWAGVPLAPDGTSPVALVPLEADGTPGTELALATTGGGVWIADVGPDRAITIRPESVASAEAVWLSAGDLNRDGLADLVVGGSRSVTTLRAIGHLDP